MTYRTIIGIDPGMSGALALMHSGIAHWIKFTATEADVADFLIGWIATDDNAFAFIESVHSMPKQGVASSFKFGRSYGFLRGLLIGLKIPFEEVSPQRWQKEMDCMSKGDKNKTKARAQQLFPQEKITHAIADAMLIAEYGRRTLAKRSHEQDVA